MEAETPRRMRHLRDGFAGLLLRAPASNFRADARRGTRYLSEGVADLGSGLVAIVAGATRLLMAAFAPIVCWITLAWHVYQDRHHLGRAAMRSRHGGSHVSAALLNLTTDRLRYLPWMSMYRRANAIARRGEARFERRIEAERRAIAEEQSRTGVPEAAP